MQPRAYLLSLAAVAFLAGGLRSARAQEDINDLYEKAAKAAVAKVAPSVVQIETTGGTDMIAVGKQGMQVRKGVGPTTGVIVSGDGYVISSAFNFVNKPTAIFVTVPSHKERYVAKVVANDQTRMLTLLKIEANGLAVPQAAPVKDFKIGQTALALGRTLERADDRELTGLPSVSVGVLSALHRIWGKAVQTDAKVSPVNYGGPLVDITGKVIGILVPASPNDEGATAGLEWYDSGIGFAIPLEDINGALPRLRQGTDLRRGLLGITMQGGDKYALPATVSTVAPDSAAQKAGLKPGDEIIEVDGKPVQSQAQLLHATGGKYEGDTVNLKLKRGNETVEIKDMKLAGSLTAFPHAFLGVVPLRDDPDAGEEIRYVYPKSPADAAGLKSGDRITKIGLGAGPLQPFNGRDQLTARLNTLQPATEVKLEVIRKADKKTETVTVKLGALVDALPDKLPELATMKRALEAPKGGKAPPKQDKKAETGMLKRTNQTRDHEYFMYVPETYDPNVSHALLLWLHPVGKGKDKDLEDFQAAWKDICIDHNIILVMPKSDNENGWLGSESEAVVGIVQDVLGQYTIDRQRVVAHGMGIGGQMAYYLGFTARDLIRGVAATGAVMTSPVKETIPNQRLQFFVVAGGKDPLAKDIQESKNKLTTAKFSVVYREIPEMGHQYLDAKTLDDLVKWLDSLDRQ
ncbi:MAG: PDZ domain-containing protein [Planctomycetia bacterium]|nr:PDZ domain-containing protein [Planctomycetia bacterium]